MKRGSTVLKTVISLSPKVKDWGKALAEQKGFESNFSAYIADLIRRDYNASQLSGQKLLAPLSKIEKPVTPHTRGGNLNENGCHVS